MKRLLSFICLALIITALCSCSSVGKSEAGARASALGDLYYPMGVPENANEVPNMSAFIVQGKLLDDAQEDIQTLDLSNGSSPEKKLITYAATISTLEITKVIQGDLEVGDQVKLAESYYTVEEDGVKTIKMAPGYTKLYAPSKVGQEYLFFFDKPAEDGVFADIYFPLWRELGRYPVVSPLSRTALSVDDMSNEELNLGEGDATEYKEFYKQVIQKFMW